ncbi:DUF3576 domain-containing protein [Halovulum dunhuangense]|uniref:DUF3576 domain-containing protein n=1 Tax=Halovulum dunhuangense TaxID=1505036 RepID=A0A849KX83_9RHOB|nr:DUF3576 domain-containing protein [Halovulum dunhuangense]NNU79077.1 DUF3576 domain-containing protein [Halovulum dunhuangense]
MHQRLRTAGFAILCAALAGCGGGDDAARDMNIERQRENLPTAGMAERESFLSLFTPVDESREINVNRNLWRASLDVLSMFPLEAADPFSGVISTGWGRVNGASAPYRATVYVTGPALDARSLRVAVFRQSGGSAVAVSDQVAAQIEDAILTRARQFTVAAQGPR